MSTSWYQLHTSAALSCCCCHQDWHLLQRPLGTPGGGDPLRIRVVGTHEL